MAVEPTAYSTYLDAYLSNKQPSVTPDVASRTSTASHGYAYASMPKCPADWSYEPLPKKTISVLRRPSSPTPSRKNVENIDTQYRADKGAFERRASGFRRLAQESYHHNAPAGSLLTMIEQGHIVDRGRGRHAGPAGGEEAAFDPINHWQRAALPIDSAADSAEVKFRANRPSSAPHVRPSAGLASAASPRPPFSVPRKVMPEGAKTPPPAGDKLLQVSRGRYNPLTHQFSEPPSETYVARKAREFSMANGGLGIRCSVDHDGIFNPIKGEWQRMRTPAASSATPARMNDVDDVRHTWSKDQSDHSQPPTKHQAPPHTPASHPTAHGMKYKPNSSAAAAAVVAVATSPTVSPVQPQRPVSAPRPSRSLSNPRQPSYTRVSHGESWGTYNPILHEWAPGCSPKNAHYAGQEPLDRKAGISGSLTARVAPPRQQGVYNPLLNVWVVPPADTRVMAGLAFAPATMFSRPTPSTVRM